MTESHKDIKNRILDTLLEADHDGFFSLMNQISDKDRHSLEIEELLTHVLDKIGSLWEEGSVSLAQIYIAGNIVEEYVDERFQTRSIEDSHVGFITLLDHHILGLKIVSSYLNFKKIPHQLLGFGLEPEEVISKLQGSNIKVLLISTLMYPSALKVKELKQLMDRSGLDHIKIVVGGAPFRLDSTLCREVGADGYAKNAQSTYDMVLKYLNVSKEKV